MLRPTGQYPVSRTANYVMVSSFPGRATRNVSWYASAVYINRFNKVNFTLSQSSASAVGIIPTTASASPVRHRVIADAHCCRGVHDVCGDVIPVLIESR